MRAEVAWAFVAGGVAAEEGVQSAGTPVAPRSGDHGESEDVPLIGICLPMMLSGLSTYRR